MRCSICHTLCQPEDFLHTCAGCAQEYHQTCWDDLGGCATYGCEKATVAEKPPAPAVMPAGWGDTKTCPRCDKEIPSNHLRCSCGARFPHADPMTKEEHRAWFSESRSLRSVRATLIWLFILSLTGLLAPILGLIAGMVAYRNRDRLVGSDGTHLAMGYGAAGLGCAYSTIILILFLGG